MYELNFSIVSANLEKESPTFLSPTSDKDLTFNRPKEAALASFSFSHRILLIKRSEGFVIRSNHIIYFLKEKPCRFLQWVGCFIAWKSRVYLRSKLY